MEQIDHMNYQESLPRLQRLKADWSDIVGEIDINRRLRHIDFSVSDLQKGGKIAADETMIAMRLVDVNIKREQPVYVGFLTQPRRLAIFKHKQDPMFIPDKIEAEFTRVMKYLDWEKPHFKLIDGFQCHGWAFYEVVFDESKPGHVAVEAVNPDRLWFSKKALDIQHCEEVIRVYDISALQLKRFVNEYGFSETQVDQVLETVDQNLKDEVFTIYKRFCKKDDMVYVAWFSLNPQCDDWLREPLPLYLGMDSQGTDEMGLPLMDKQYEHEYPLVPAFYMETEQPTIVEHRGRVFLDKHKQEAQSCTATGFINKLLRSSDVYAAVEASDIVGGEPRQLDVKLQHGAIYDKPVRFFSAEPPDSTAIQALQFFDVYNSQEAGQINYAANNRQDTRKTATEIQAAQRDNTLLSSTSVTIFSTTLRKLWNACWRIIQNRALNNKIEFCSVQGQNDLALISQDFEIYSAGDTDVVERQEKIQRMLNLMSIVANTSIAQQYIAKLLKYAFPDENFDILLGQEDEKVGVIRALNELLGATLSKEEMAALSPEELQKVQRIQASTAKYL